MNRITIADDRRGPTGYAVLAIAPLFTLVLVLLVCGMLAISRFTLRWQESVYSFFTLGLACSTLLHYT